MNVLEPRLDAILRNPDNYYCADCGGRGPRWSSVWLGILICPQCAGIHRKLGTHISFVQSVTIDKWKLEWVELCEKIVNRISNLYYEANVPDHIKKPTASDNGALGGDTIEAQTAAKLEKWIRNKYELKLFVPTGVVEPRELVRQGIDPRGPDLEAERRKAKKEKKEKRRALSESSPKAEEAGVRGDLLESPPAAAVDNGNSKKLILPDFEWSTNVFLSSWVAAQRSQ